MALLVVLTFARLVSVGKLVRSTTLLPLRSSSVTELGSCGKVTKLGCPRWRLCRLVTDLNTLCGVAVRALGQYSFDRDLGSRALREMPE